MPAFLKSPKFIGGAIAVLWVAYVLYANFQFEAVQFYLLPFKLLVLQLRLSAVVIGAALFGVAATVVVQWLWRRRSSKNASSAPAASSRTVA